MEDRGRKIEVSLPRKKDELECRGAEARRRKTIYCEVSRSREPTDKEDITSIIDPLSSIVYPLSSGSLSKANRFNIRPFDFNLAR